jgi:hypothetical protein
MKYFLPFNNIIATESFTSIFANSPINYFALPNNQMLQQDHKKLTVVCLLSPGVGKLIENSLSQQVFPKPSSSLTKTLLADYCFISNFLKILYPVQRASSL